MVRHCDDITEKLLSKDIKPSFQRMKIYEYLCKNKNHPTVDQIYKDLQKQIPTLSKATIYNTLNILLKANLVRAMTIEDKETRYDIFIENHGHFKCELCGEIYDFSIKIDNFLAEELSGFNITSKNVYFKGICSKCL